MKNLVKAPSRALMAVVLTAMGSALMAELPITTSFKFGFGSQTGGLQETSDRGYLLNASAQIDYKLTEKGAVVCEIGWRYLPGMERVASRYQQQNVSAAAVGTSAYYKYETGQVLRDEMYNIRSQGWQLGLLYSHQLPMEFYAFGGLRLCFLNTREMVLGSEIVAGTAPASQTAATPIVSVTDLGKANEISAMSPGVAIGIGYTFLKSNSVECSITNANVETDRFGKKSGMMIDFVYRMKF
ncbi:MAG: hypothetical protein LBH03_00620 [Holophagales bacterium]|jgi:hypothetical protein|nr:hypothetical protein [Holophagales bacterium]